MKAKKTKKKHASGSAVKRFAVFSGAQFYASGGWSDFQSSHATLAEARRASKPGDWWQIVDLTSGQIVEEDF